MLVYRLLNPRQVTEFVNGTKQAAGAAGSGNVGTAVFTDNVGAPFGAGVAVNDVLHITGDAQDYTITAVTNPNNLAIAPNLAATYASTQWVIHRGGRPFADFDFLQAVRDGTEFAALYEETTFAP